MTVIRWKICIFNLITVTLFRFARNIDEIIIICSTFILLICSWSILWLATSGCSTMTENWPLASFPSLSRMMSVSLTALSIAWLVIRSFSWKNTLQWWKIANHWWENLKQISNLSYQCFIDEIKNQVFEKNILHWWKIANHWWENLKQISNLSFQSLIDEPIKF